MSGHQIAVHTWSHPYLTTLTNEQIIAELGWTKKIMKDVTGVTPNMMRPPFGDIEYVFDTIFVVVAKVDALCHLLVTGFVTSRLRWVSSDSSFGWEFCSRRSRSDTSYVDSYVSDCYLRYRW